MIATVVKPVLGIGCHYLLHRRPNGVQYVKGASLGGAQASVQANGFVFVSGQIGLREGQLQNASFDAEARQVMENIGRILAEHQLDFAQVVSATIYLTDMGQFAAINSVYGSYFPGQFPSRPCVSVVALPLGAQVEITVTAQLAPR